MGSFAVCFFAKALALLSGLELIDQFLNLLSDYQRVRNCPTCCPTYSIKGVCPLVDYWRIVMSKKVLEKLMQNVEERLQQEAELSKKLEENNRDLEENLRKINETNRSKHE